MKNSGFLISAFVVYVVSFVLFFSFLVLVLARLSSVWPTALTLDLKLINNDKYQIAKSISDGDLFEGKDVEFLINFNPALLLYSYSFTMPSKYPNTVFLSPIDIYSDYFDIIIAHELGHLHYKHPRGSIENQIEADKFTALVCGRNRVIKFMNSFLVGSEEKLLRMVALDKMTAQ